jgi:hypothetical protein
MSAAGALPHWVRFVAAKKAMKDMQVRPYVSVATEKKMKKMTDDEKVAFLADLKRQHIKYALKSCLEPKVTVIKLNERGSYFVGI